MSQKASPAVRLKMSAEAARILQPGVPRDVQLAAACGTLPLPGRDQLTLLCLLCRSEQGDIKNAALKSLREMTRDSLLPVLKDPSLPSEVLRILARVRLADVAVMEAVLLHPAVSEETLLDIARKADAGVLERLAAHRKRYAASAEIAAAMIANPAAGESLKIQLGEQAPQDLPEEDACEEGRSQEDLEAMIAEADREGLSKYQIAADLKVAEKIKLGLSGDKEWRTLLIKDPNKLVQAAVMKNPRITDGEVLMVAKNKSASDEVIRLILLNKDWVKLYEIKKALVVHPKTPAPKALRMVPFLSLRDIKELARSRQVPTLVATAARKELDMRRKRMGG
ncbi:MAG: hypothetical protein P8Y91_04610 [Desulfuromonadales bacterium]